MMAGDESFQGLLNLTRSDCLIQIKLHGVNRDDAFKPGGRTVLGPWAILGCQHPSW